MTDDPVYGDDIIARILDEWDQRALDVDPSAMGIVGRIIVLGRRYEKRVNTLLSDEGLTYTDFDVLATLRRSGEPYALTPTELRQSVLLSSGAMTAALGRLTSQGLIERKPGKDDGRTLIAQLTELGRIKIEPLIKARFVDAEAALEGLAAVERERVEALLIRLLKARPSH